MLECDKTVTLIHHEKGVDGDTYLCIPVSSASWFQKTTISTSGDGAKPSNSYECRIMTNDEGIPIFESVINEFIPSLGDYVALGVVSGIMKPSDLKNIVCFRITSIGDNRRGFLPHWRLSGQ